MNKGPIYRFYEHDKAGEDIDLGHEDCSICKSARFADSNEGKLLKLLKRAHDAMDEHNNHALPDGFIWCDWCKGSGYDGDGIQHKDECILVEIRQLISEVER